MHIVPNTLPRIHLECLATLQGKFGKSWDLVRAGISRCASSNTIDSRRAHNRRLDIIRVSRQDDSVNIPVYMSFDRERRDFLNRFNVVIDLLVRLLSELALANVGQDRRAGRVDEEGRGGLLREAGGDGFGSRDVVAVREVEDDVGLLCLGFNNRP